MPGGGFYMERKKLAWRAAGAGKWTGYEGVAGSGQQYRRSERSERSRGIKETGYEGVAAFRRRHIFIAEL